MNILIAEDEPSIAEQYMLVLKGRGHNVRLTLDGRKCVDVYNEALTRLPDSSEEYLACYPPFDMVLLDYRMPRMDGLEAAKLILSANPHQRIIFASAYVMSTLQESVKYLHSVVELMQKPFDLDAMVDVVERTSRSKELKLSEYPAVESYNEELPEISNAVSVSTDASRPDMLVIAGVNFARKAKLVDAFDCFLRAIELNPNNARAWYNIAVSLSMLGNDLHNHLILYCYDQATELDPYYLEAWNNKAAALEATGKYEDAIFCYKRALDINYRHGKAQRNLVSLLLRMGRKSEAKEYFGNIMKI